MSTPVATRPSAVPHRDGHEILIVTEGDWNTVTATLANGESAVWYRGWCYVNFLDSAGKLRAQAYLPGSGRRVAHEFSEWDAQWTMHERSPITEITIEQEKRPWEK